MQPMPTGSPIRRRAENNFKPEFTQKFGRMAWTYFEYVSHCTGNTIQHMFNRGEKKLGQHGLPVDGYCELTNNVYQFHGCMWHGHKCEITEGVDINPVNKASMQQLQIDSESKQDYIKALGYNLIVMRECHWKNLLKLDPDVRDFVSKLEFRTMSENQMMTEDEIVQALQQEKFFGLIECDISVPDHLKEKFSEMQPIFKNVTVTREYLSKHMKQFAEQSGHLKNGQKMLVGSWYGNQILLLTSLAGI